MKKTILSIVLMGCSALSLSAADGNTTETKTVTKTKTTITLPTNLNPHFKFGGYAIARYKATDEEKTSSNSTFGLRLLRLYASGDVFNDFYFKFQLHMNGTPGGTSSARIVDAFIEWQKYDFACIKVGQFKRPFSFEDPYSPWKVGLGSYAQSISKLTGFSDRVGEHASNGRDIGLQVQGDLFKATDNHSYLHYQVGLFNGQGTNTNDKDNNKDFIGGLWVNPIKHLSIGGFVWRGKFVNEDLNANELISTDRNRWSVGVKYEDAWTFRSEYIYSKGQKVDDISSADKADGFYATIGVPVANKLKIYGRYDLYRDNQEWNSAKTQYGLAANWQIAKDLLLQANYYFTHNKLSALSSDKNTNMIDLQVYARF